MPWSHNFMSNQEEPELATNRNWREEMIAARESAGLTQEQLGKIVGATQVSISKIETGEHGSSKFVRPICRALKIYTPEHYATDEDRIFMHELSEVRRNFPERYRAVVDLVHSIAVEEKH